MCFIEKESQNFILKSREIFPWRETVLRAHGMKSDKKLFFCRIYAIFWEKWLWLKVLFSISEGFWRFFLTQGYHW